MMQAIRQVLESGIDEYYAPRRWEIEGIPIIYKPLPNDTRKDEWRTILEKWLPRFDEVGWLDGLNKISIGQDITKNDTVATYYPSSGSISMENDASNMVPNGRTVSDTLEHILLHEMIHHAHMTINGNKQDFGPVDSTIAVNVSPYASKNGFEAVAETGVGIVIGEEYPEWVHEYYEELDGPQEVYELG